MIAAPEAWGYIEPDTIPCPCMGDFETCELCDGTGSVNPHKPAGPIGHLKLYVMEARYAAGVSLYHPEDAWNPRPRGSSEAEETDEPGYDTNEDDDDI